MKTLVENMYKGFKINQIIGYAVLPLRKINDLAVKWIEIGW